MPRRVFTRVTRPETGETRRRARRYAIDGLIWRDYAESKTRSAPGLAAALIFPAGKRPDSLERASRNGAPRWLETLLRSRSLSAAVTRSRPAFLNDDAASARGKMRFAPESGYLTPNTRSPESEFDLTSEDESSEWRMPSERNSSEGEIPSMKLDSS